MIQFCCINQKPMDIAGYIAAIFIGISLGLIGGGGSILTVPVLVYLFHIDAILATTYSLFIVGTTSVAGSFSYLSKGLVNIKTVLFFGIPSTVAVFISRTYILPAIPPQVLQLGGFTLTKGLLLLLVFAILMVLAAYAMIKKGKTAQVETTPEQPFNYSLILLEGLGVGALTGLVGAGGGFLIIPALVNFMKLPIKTAIGTSLVIIAFNSLAGFIFSITHTSIQWVFISIISLLAVIGILAGSYISTKIDGRKLKPAFGWFVLIMGTYIILRETIL